MKLSVARQLGKHLIEKHNLIGWKLQFDKSVRRFGRCAYKSKTINLSAPITKLNGELAVRDVILHEIAHALVGAGNGHNRKWQLKALEIGADGKRCYGEDVAVPAGKYKATCPNCKELYERHRRPSRATACAKCCGGRFNPAYILEYK